MQSLEEVQELAKKLGIVGWSRYKKVEDLLQRCEKKKELNLPKVFNKDILNRWYLGKPKYKLREWFPKKSFRIREAAKNPKTITYIEDLLANGTTIDFEIIASNPNASHLFSEFPDAKNYMETICQNPGAIAFIKNIIKKEPWRVSWESLSLNPEAQEFFTSENRDVLKILDVNRYMMNPGMIEAIEYLFENKEASPSDTLLGNPVALHLIEELEIDIEDRIRTFYLCMNPAARDLILKLGPGAYWTAMIKNPAMIDFIEEKYDSEESGTWVHNLYSNPAAIDILRRECEKGKVSSLMSSNPEIFELDYRRMKEEAIASGFKEELVKKVFHPSRVLQRIEQSQASLLDTLESM